MNLLDKIGREFSGYNLLESGVRLFDRKPLQCSLYLTDNCNLDCSYCTEYDNSKPHPKLEDLKLWIRKIRDLGTMRIALVAANLSPIRMWSRSSAIAANWIRHQPNDQRLPPDAKTIEGTGRSRPAGDADQRRSYDASLITKKSFKTILPKLDYFKDSKISVHITGSDLCRHPAGIKSGAGKGSRVEFPPRYAWSTPIRGAGSESSAAIKRSWRSLHRFDDCTETARRKNPYERSDPPIPEKSFPERAGRVDLQRRLQTFFCFRAGKILDLQHDAHREAHHGYYAR